MTKIIGQETELEALRHKLREGDEWRERMAVWLERLVEASADRGIVCEGQVDSKSYIVVERWPSRMAYLELVRTLDGMRAATFSADAPDAKPRSSTRA